MNPDESRYRVTAALLQADGPVTLAELVAETGASRPAVLAALGALTEEHSVVEGDLVPGKPGPQYFWAARWAKGPGVRGAGRKTAAARSRPQQLDIADELVLAFHNFIINDYAPPRDKRLLVVFQCSVRRPFSKSPSHASMRRAVAAATGYDPAAEFEACPVHVVVLASRIGPVPYELEDFFPANARGGGVKHFGPDHYARVKPILAARMAQYLAGHGGHYDRVAAFTHGRYGEVMREAAKIAAMSFPVLPEPNGPRVVRMGDSRPRTYWQRYWIQLYLEIAGWLDPAARAQAGRRLAALKVTYR